MCKTLTTPTDQKLLEDLQRFPNIFSKLTAEGQNTERLTAKVNVSGYSGLVFLAMDILKAALLTLEVGNPYGDTEDAYPEPDVANLIDLAIQLMPLEELELLDILHQHHLEKQKQQ
jgi:hypothetical protein